MEYVYVGKIVSTHGIKGEIRIISDFEFKDKAFVVDKKIYLGSEKREFIIKSYRKHKNYDMITLEGFSDINLVLPFMKELVYIKEEDLCLEDNEYLDDSLIGLDVYYNDEHLGKIVEIFSPSPNRKVIRFNKDGKNYLVPYVPNFVKKIDLSNRKVLLYNMEGVLECE